MDDDKKRPSENSDYPEAPKDLKGKSKTVIKTSSAPSNDVENLTMALSTNDKAPVTTRRKKVAKTTLDVLERKPTTENSIQQVVIPENTILSKKAVAKVLENTGLSQEAIEVIAEAFDVINKIITLLEIQKSTKLLITKSASQKLASLKKEIPTKALEELNSFLDEILASSEELSTQLKRSGVKYLINPERKYALNQEGLSNLKKIITVYEKSAVQARKFLNDFFVGRGQVVQDIPVAQRDLFKNRDIITKVATGDDSMLKHVDKNAFSRNVEKTYQDVVEQDIELQNLEDFFETLNKSLDNKHIFSILLSLINLHLMRLKDMPSQFTFLLNQVVQADYQRPEDEFQEEDFETETKTLSMGLLRMLRSTQITELLKRYLK